MIAQVTSKSSSVLIIGCGYVGLPLALQLRESGAQVTGWVYTPANGTRLRQDYDLSLVWGDVADSAGWERMPPQSTVIHCASSRGGEEQAYRKVYLQGMENVVRYQESARKIFVSSTSVYGQNDGSWVTESSPVAPEAPTSKVLLAAESVASTGRCVVLRSSGIYGPGRTRQLDDFRGGSALLEGKGDRWLNQIHRDDLIGAIRFFIDQPDLGRGEVFNVTDDEPVTQLAYFEELAARLNLPVPPSGPLRTERRRGFTNKRIDNRKLREIGWNPRYPNFRVGLDSLLKPG